MGGLAVQIVPHDQKVTGSKCMLNYQHLFKVLCISYTCSSGSCTFPFWFICIAFMFDAKTDIQSFIPPLHYINFRLITINSRCFLWFLHQLMTNEQNHDKPSFRKKCFLVCVMVLVHLAFRYERVSTNFVSILFSLQNSFDFCASLGDVGTRVPTRKLHTRPGYINTRIVPGLVTTHSFVN